MGLDIHTATIRMARDVRAAEAAVEKALVNTVALLHSAATARADVDDVDAVVGQRPMLRMHSAVGKLLELRGEMLRVHDELANVGKEVGTMDEPTCPDDHVFTGASAPAEVKHIA